MNKTLISEITYPTLHNNDTQRIGSYIYNFGTVSLAEFSWSSVCRYMYIYIHMYVLFLIYMMCVCVCISESESHSVMSDCLQPHGLYSPWNSPGDNTGMGRLTLLQEIFPTQGLNPGLPHCRQILYQLSHKGSLIPNRSSYPRNWTGVSCIDWAIRVALCVNVCVCVCVCVCVWLPRWC